MLEILFLLQINLVSLTLCTCTVNRTSIPAIVLPANNKSHNIYDIIIGMKIAFLGPSCLVFLKILFVYVIEISMIHVHKLDMVIRNWLSY